MILAALLNTTFASPSPLSSPTSSPPSPLSLPQSAFACWAKDWLIKHGMTSQKADALLFRVGEVTASVMFDVKLAQHFFIEKLAINRTFRVSNLIIDVVE